jgi:chromosome segregation ATPase
VLLAATLTASGCAMVKGTSTAMLMRADHLAEQGDYSAAVVAYDEFLARHADDSAASRALASRDHAAAIVTVRAELERLREEVLRLREEVTQRDSDLARARHELAARQADVDRLRASLERLKEIDLKLERKRR